MNSPKEVKLRLALKIALLLIPLLAWGQAHPNFSGTWRLNNEKSTPVMPSGYRLTYVIHHADPDIVTEQTRSADGKTTRTTLKKTTDGLEHISHPQPDSTVKERQSWSGARLTGHWEMRKGATVYLSDIETALSPDGTIMTMHEVYRAPGTIRTHDWVFEKQ